MANYREVDVDIKSTCADPAFYFKNTDDGMITVISVMYVDESLLSLNKVFFELSNEVLQNFESKKIEMDNIKFSI